MFAEKMLVLIRYSNDRGCSCLAEAADRFALEPDYIRSRYFARVGLFEA